MLSHSAFYCLAFENDKMKNIFLEEYCYIEIIAQFYYFHIIGVKVKIDLYLLKSKLKSSRYEMSYMIKE